MKKQTQIRAKMGSLSAFLLLEAGVWLLRVRPSDVIQRTAGSDGVNVIREPGDDKAAGEPQDNGHPDRPVCSRFTNPHALFPALMTQVSHAKNEWGKSDSSTAFGIGAGLAEITIPDDFEALFRQLDGLTLEAATVDGAVDEVARVAGFRDAAFGLVFVQELHDQLVVGEQAARAGIAEENLG